MRDAPESGQWDETRRTASLLRFGGFTLDLDACTLVREAGEAVALTRGEFALLRVFVSRPGRVLSRDALLDAVANRRFEPFDRSVDVMVGKLRRKIEPDPKAPRLIVTVPGEGYRFDGLTKTPPSGLTQSAVVPTGQHEEPARGVGHDGPSQQWVAPQWQAAASSAKTNDQANSPLSKSRLSSWPLALSIAALVLLAAAAGWLLLGGPFAKPAGHLSIVVLPFANLSGEASQDHFADGVTDYLTTELSRVRNTFVVARNTAFTYKGRSVDAKEIGKQLGVRYVLEGSVQRDQNRVRVNAQLVDAEAGGQVWAERFEEDVADLFKLQDEVVARLTRSLALALTKSEAERSPSRNPDAIDLTMRAFDVVIRGIDTKSKNLEARALFERAFQIDPNDARALAGSAETYFYDYLFGWGDAGTDYDAKVLGQAEQAINLTPDDSYVYYPKAIYLALSGRPAAALRAANAGLDVNPNDVLLYQPRGVAENSLGQYEQAKADMVRAMRLSPHDILSGVFHVILGDAEIGLGHFDAAIDAYRKAIDSGVRQFFVYSDLAAAYAQAGEVEDARAALAEARRLNPGLTISWMTNHTPNLPAVFDGLRKAGLPEQ